MATSYKKCRTCGNIFPSNGQKECPRCVMAVEKQFGVIKDYLYNNPNATVVQIAEATEVDERQILNFLKEGRLEMKSADGFLKCEKCGAPITSGRMCPKCMNSLSNALNKVLPNKEPQVQREKTVKSGSNALDKLHVDINKRG